MKTNSYPTPTEVRAEAEAIAAEHAPHQVAFYVDPHAGGISWSYRADDEWIVGAIGPDWEVWADACETTVDDDGTWYRTSVGRGGRHDEAKWAANDAAEETLRLAGLEERMDNPADNAWVLVRS